MTFWPFNRHPHRSYRHRLSARLPLLCRRLVLGCAALSAILTGTMIPAVARDTITVDFRQARPITVAVGQSMTVQLTEAVAELVVGNSEIADVTPMTDHSFYIQGKAFGRTNIVAYGSGRHVIGVLDVEATADLDDLRQALRQSVPEAQITVSSVNGQLRLSGIAPNAVAAGKAMELARQYGSPNVINSIRIASSQQVMLEVRFLEARHAAGRDLGVGIRTGSRTTTSVTGAFQYPTGEGAGGVISFNGSLPGGTPFGTVLSRVLNAGVSVDVLIQALESRNLARTLAEPNLVALSGETASFLAGGEVPIPTSQGDGQISVDYKEYGIRLNFTPVVLDGGLINLALEPEVSQVDLATTVQANGISVPGFITRRASTTVELRDGQSFAIAGLLQSVNSRRQTQLPWVGHIPILGALFRSSSYQRDETDLVIIVTPHLVKPASPAQLLATPGDNSRLSNDTEFFLFGVQEVGPNAVRRYIRNARNLGPHGYILPPGGKSR